MHKPLNHQPLSLETELRFTIVLTMTAIHLVGMDVVSARREAPQWIYGSGRETEMACLHWRQQGGQFSSLPLSSKLEEHPPSAENLNPKERNGILTIR